MSTAIEITFLTFTYSVIISISLSVINNNHLISALGRSCTGTISPMTSLNHSKQGWDFSWLVPAGEQVGLHAKLVIQVPSAAGGASQGNACSVKSCDGSPLELLPSPDY